MKRFSRLARTVYTCAEELIEHIILIGGSHQMLDWQTHHTGNMPSADVAEVA